MKYFIISILALTLFGNGLCASSPVTLVSFYHEFSNVEEVGIMQQLGSLDGRVANFLLDENQSIVEKAAIINALVDSDQDRRNASTFKQFAARKYRLNFETMDLNQLKGDELFCLGYLTLIDDFGKPENALPILELAVSKKPDSFTVNLIYAMTLAQQNINFGKNCEAWNNFTTVQNNTGLNNDMENNIVSYFLVEIEPYKEGCN